jgi:hypothetical protein
MIADAKKMGFPWRNGRQRRCATIACGAIGGHAMRSRVFARSGPAAVRAAEHL